MTNQTPPEPSTTAEDLAEEYWLSEAAESSDCNIGGHFTAKEIRKAYITGYAASENDMTPLDERCFRAGVKEGRRLRDAEVERLETARKVHVEELHNADAELTQLRQSLAESERKAAKARDFLGEVFASLKNADVHGHHVAWYSIENDAESLFRELSASTAEALAAADESEGK